MFETPRLILRRFTVADAPLVYELNSQPEVTRYVHEAGLQDIAHAGQVIRDIILPQYENNLGRWAIHTKDENTFIGWCGLKYLAEEKEIDLGYRLHPAYWNHGYATEAASHTLAYGFKTLGLKLIVGKAHAENVSSINVLQKICMQFIKDIVEDDCPVKVYASTNPDLKIAANQQA